VAILPRHGLIRGARNDVAAQHPFLAKIRLGISSCLLGRPVRFDGGHKHDRFLTDTLGAWVDYVPVCPEIEAGFGVPRESMRLEGDPAAPRLVTRQTRRDVTGAMLGWAARRVEKLAKEDLDGFIFKSDSPSSGMERVRVYGDKGMPVKTGVGLFARAFMERFPLLPVEEEGRLHDPALRENFIEAIFTLRRWRELPAAGRSSRDLVDFHTRHKLLIMSHSVEHYRRMGRLVADTRALPLPDLFAHYEALLLEALRLPASSRKQVNVLQHMAGYFKDALSADEKRELGEVIERYRAGLVPLVVPLTLIGHYVRTYDQPYLRDQVYLNPHPLELQLRNHA
jgi:uncharacterized protein YbgA (DUF1722 family)/uncharacterized protein YbbK (DUF523 family)